MSLIYTDVGKSPRHNVAEVDLMLSLEVLVVAELWFDYEVMDW